MVEGSLHFDRSVRVETHKELYGEKAAQHDAAQTIMIGKQIVDQALLDFVLQLPDADGMNKWVTLQHAEDHIVLQQLQVWQTKYNENRGQIESA